MYETLKYYDIEDFCASIENKIATDDKFKYFAITAKYEEAKDIVAELVFLGYKLGFIDLNFEYFDEYEITVIEDSIMCEPLKKGGEYIESGATTIYTMGDVNSKCIKECYLEADDVFIVEFAKCDLENELDDDIFCDSDNDEDVIGNLYDWYYSGDIIFTHNMVRKMLKLLD